MNISALRIMNSSTGISHDLPAHAAARHARSCASLFGQTDQGPCLLLGRAP